MKHVEELDRRRAFAVSEFPMMNEFLDPNFESLNVVSGSSSFYSSSRVWSAPGGTSPERS